MIFLEHSALKKKNNTVQTGNKRDYNIKEKLKEQGQIQKYQLWPNESSRVAEENREETIVK